MLFSGDSAGLPDGFHGRRTVLARQPFVGGRARAAINAPAVGARLSYSQVLT